MSKRCELTDVGVMAGNNVSHSNRKTRRRFLPNLHVVSLKSEVLGQVFKLKITSATLRSIDHNGGFDQFLVTAKAKNLSETGQKIRRKIKKNIEAASASAPASA